MTTTASPPSPTAAVSLSRQEKEKLLQQMYNVPLWIELIRLFRYQTLPMDEARKALKPLAQKHGKEPTAAACEVLVEISTPGSDAFARLKPHIRRMAFQILGPEPCAQAPSDPVATPPTLPVSESQVPPQAAPKKTRKPAKALAPKRPRTKK